MKERKKPSPCFALAYECLTDVSTVAKRNVILLARIHPPTAPPQLLSVHP